MLRCGYKMSPSPVPLPSAVLAEGDVCVVAVLVRSAGRARGPGALNLAGPMACSGAEHTHNVLDASLRAGAVLFGWPRLPLGVAGTSMSTGLCPTALCLGTTQSLSGLQVCPGAGCRGWAFPFPRPGGLGYLQPWQDALPSFSSAHVRGG